MPFSYNVPLPQKKRKKKHCSLQMNILFIFQKVDLGSLKSGGNKEK